MLTLEEVNTLEKIDNDNFWVEPKHWEQNLDQAAFLKWKADLKSHAEIMTENRRNKEIELTNSSLLKQRLQQFFEHYPKDARDLLKEGISQLEEKILSIEEDLKSNQARSKEIFKEQQAIRDDVQSYQNEMNGLGRKIEKAHNFLTIEKQLNSNRKQLAAKSQVAESLVREIKLLSKQIKRYQEDIENLEEEKHDAESEIQIIHANDDFQAVQHGLLMQNVASEGFAKM